MSGAFGPFGVIDLWGHAYYLKYQGDRADYLNSFWNIVNWEHIGQLYENVPLIKDRFTGAIKRFT